MMSKEVKQHVEGLAGLDVLPQVHIHTLQHQFQ
jgi:hypothetical protein